MIEYHYELDFELDREDAYTDWLNKVAISERRIVGRLNFIFCSDDYLTELNLKYLKHNTLTDILTFDYTNGDEIVGDVFISVERVVENAKDLNIAFKEELLRVMAHGVLHICGYGDKTEPEMEVMRGKENEKIKMFHVEQ